MRASTRHVLLTGVTGLLGKVVLEQLIRNADDLGVARVYLLIRPRRGRAPEERFDRDVVGSECFKRLPDLWHTRCTVVGGNVTSDNLGLSDADRSTLTDRVTHIINCAASVDFDRPLEEAARSNIAGALGTLSFAKQCTSLESMVHVSTAYVWPDRAAAPAFDRTLVPLPFDPAAVYADIVAGRAKRDELLPRTGHANTYTFTKCIAEHLLFAERGEVPLRIVRPSIIGACRVDPFPGWVDTTTGFGGFVALFASGRLPVLACDPDARIDVVPCDEVSDRIMRSAFDADAGVIEHAVAGLRRTLPIREIEQVMRQQFEKYAIGSRTGVRHIGPWGRWFALQEWVYLTLPLSIAHRFYSITRQSKKARRVRRADALMRYANRGFRYFTHATFDFQGADAGSVPEFDPREYHAIISDGVSRHLLKHGSAEAPLGGHRHAEGGSDIAWAATRRRGNVTHRFGATLLRKMWRLSTELVTYDAPSFERAMAQAASGELVVIVPTHRSYFDFLVLPYLFLARPKLGIDVPFIAATEDFARIPLISPLLRQGRAFFIRRGTGQADPDLTRRVAQLAANGRTLKFFIEGTRSRSRRVLPPRRGLLRALQSTGKPCLLLPVAVSYDRVPEETPLALELAGMTKPPHRLRAILQWVRKLRRRHVKLGRIHVTCGAPLRMDAHTDIHELSRAIAGELQAATSISTFHLRAFLARCPLPGVDAVRLRRAVEHRGGVVIDSALALPSPIDDTLHEVLLNQWRPFFFADLRAVATNNAALRDHIEQHDWRGVASVGDSENLFAIPGLLEAMFASIAKAYGDVGRYMADRADSTEYMTWQAVANALPGVFRPDVELALRAMARQGLLAEHDDGFRCVADRDAIAQYAQSCAWPVFNTPAEGVLAAPRQVCTA
jgi:fatty acyl-CoA reductase